MDDERAEPVAPPKSPQEVADATFIVGWAVLNLPGKTSKDQAEFAHEAAKLLKALRVADMLARSRL